MKAYKKQQIIKHALEFYIQRPGASDQDKLQETQVWNEVTREVEELQQRFSIETIPMTDKQRAFIIEIANSLGVGYDPNMSKTQAHRWIHSHFDEYEQKMLGGELLEN